MALVSRAPSDRLNDGMLKVQVNKKSFLLLRCVYRACLYLDGDENWIHGAAFVSTQVSELVLEDRLSTPLLVSDVTKYIQTIVTVQF